MTVDNLRLMAATQVNREATLIKARDDLIKAGLVEYQKGKKGSPNRYRMVSVAGKFTFKNVAKNVDKSEMKNAVESVAKRADIDKHKQREIYNPPKSLVEDFEGFWKAYPKHGNDRPAAERAYCKVLREDCHIREQDLVAAAANYAEAMKVLGREKNYIRSAASFLTDNFFAAYLPGQYVRPERERTAAGGGKNRFNQFAQHDYDFGALEKELVVN